MLALSPYTLLDIYSHKEGAHSHGAVKLLTVHFELYFFFLHSNGQANAKMQFYIAIFIKTRNMTLPSLVHHLSRVSNMTCMENYWGKNSIKGWFQN